MHMRNEVCMVGALFQWLGRASRSSLGISAEFADGRIRMTRDGLLAQSSIKTVAWAKPKETLPQGTPPQKCLRESILSKSLLSY
eukprot:216302-Pelagomonas_calceolata.AAC.1